ncbi:hypothetical protein [Secundilactobacillus kimchicus]|uniref:hypothetical protein n=1 Tax=Secundilactobacillus kimchicus TaxID=528209 RepID=UPI0006D09669|nr:hypothetical protein [Secundilactobacillus kimchicus]
MKKLTKKRGRQLIVGLSATVLMTPLITSSAVEAYLGAESIVNAAAKNKKLKDPKKGVTNATTPDRNTNKLIKSTIKYSHKVPVLDVSVRPSDINFVKKGETITYTFSDKNVNLKHLQASKSDNLPFSYKKLSSTKLQLTFKKSLTSGAYSQAFAIPTKNVKMTTKAKAQFDDHVLAIGHNSIKSVRQATSKKTQSQNQQQQQNGNSQQTQQPGTQQQGTTQSNGSASQTTSRAAATPNTAATQQTQTTPSTTTTTAAQSTPTTTTPSSTASAVAPTTGSTSGTATTGTATTAQPTATATQPAVTTPSTTSSTTTPSSTTTSTTATPATTQSSSTTPVTTTSTTAPSASTASSTTSVTANQATTATPATPATPVATTTTTSSTVSQSTPAATVSQTTSTTTATTNSTTQQTQTSSSDNVSATDAYNTVLNRTQITQSSEPTTDGNSTSSAGSGNVTYVTTPAPEASDPTATLKEQLQSSQTTSTNTTATTDAATTNTAAQTVAGSTESTTATENAASNAVNQTANTAATTGTATGSTQSTTSDKTAVKAATATETADSSEGTALFNNIQTQINDKTSSWATATEQGEIVKTLPWILHDIADKLPDSPTGNGQMWYYEIPLTTGKYARITIDGRSNTADASSLEAQMPALLKSLGKASTPGMFDEAVDMSTLQNSSLYKTLVKMQGNGNSKGISAIGNMIGAFFSSPKDFLTLMNLTKGTQKTSSNSMLGGLGSMFGGNSLMSGMFSGISKLFSGVGNFFGKLFNVNSTVAAAPAASTLATTTSQAVSGKALTPGSMTAATLTAPVTIPMALLLPLLALSIFVLPLLIVGGTAGFLLAPITIKVVLDTTISLVAANLIAGAPLVFVVAPIVLGIAAIAFVAWHAFKAVVKIGIAVVVVGLLLLNILNPIGNTLGLMTLGVLWLGYETLSGLAKATLVAIGLALGVVGLTLFENHIVIPLAVFIGLLFVVPATSFLGGLAVALLIAGPTVFIAAPLMILGGLALVVVPVLVIASLILLPMILVTGFVIGLAGVLVLLALIVGALFFLNKFTIGFIVDIAKLVIFLLLTAIALPIFLASPLLVKIAMVLLALIPVAGWAFKKFLELITAIGFIITTFVLGISVVLPGLKLAIDAGGLAIKTAVTTGSLIAVAFGPLAVRVLLGNRVLAFIPVTLLTFAAPFLAILLLLHMAKDFALGAVKIGTDLIGLTLVGLGIVANSIHTLIATAAAILDPVAGLIVELFVVIPAFVGVLGLAAPIAVLFGLPLDLLGNLLVPGLALVNIAKFIGAFIFSVIALPFAAITLPITLGIAAIYFTLNFLVLFGLPLLSFIEALALPVILVGLFIVKTLINAAIRIGFLILDVIGLGIGFVDALITTLPKVLLYMLVPVRLLWILAIGGGLLAGIATIAGALILGLLFGWVAKLVLDVVTLAVPVLGILLIPLHLLNAFLLSILPSLLIGGLAFLATLLFGGLPLFLGLLALVIVPAILIGLLTALIPGLNLITVPLGLVSLFIGLPLALLGMLGNLLGALALALGVSLVTLLGLNTLANLLGGLLGLVLPLILLPLLAIGAVLLPLILLGLAAALLIIPIVIALILGAIALGIAMLNLLPIALPIIIGVLLLAIPLLIFGFLLSAELIWFFAPILLVLAVNPIADAVGFVISAYTAVTNPILFFGFGLINVPLAILFFIGSFVNWINPLNALFHAITAIAVIGLLAIPVIAALIIGVLVIVDALSLNPFSWFAGLLLIGGSLLNIGLVILLTINTLVFVVVPLAINLIVWLIIGLVTVFIAAVLSGGMGGILNPAFLAMLIYVPLATVESILLVLFGIAVMLNVDVIALIIGMPLIMLN